MRPGAKIVTSPRAMWAVWTAPAAEADHGPVIAWRLDDDGTLAPLILGIEDTNAHPLPAGGYITLHDDQATAEQTWRDLMREATA